MEKEMKPVVSLGVRLFVVRNDYYNELDCYEVLKEFNIIDAVKKNFAETIGENVGEMVIASFLDNGTKPFQVNIGQGIGGNYKEADLYKSFIRNPEGFEDSIKEICSSGRLNDVIDTSKLPPISKMPYHHALIADLRTPDIKAVLKRVMEENMSAIGEIVLVMPEELYTDDNKAMYDLLGKYITQVSLESISGGNGKLNKDVPLDLYLNVVNMNDFFEYASLSKAVDMQASNSSVLN